MKRKSHPGAAMGIRGINDFIFLASAYEGT